MQPINHLRNYFIRYIVALLALAVPAVYAAPTTPTGTSPGSTSSPGPTQSSGTVTLSWGGVSRATYYDLGVRDMSTNSRRGLAPRKIHRASPGAITLRDVCPLLYP